MEHLFGGSWTTDKIERIRKYLAAYMQIMKSRQFSVAYIDAFAGTGYVNTKQKMIQNLFPVFAESEVQEFIKGSAKTALEIQPPFNKYIFIEKNKAHFAELGKLKEEFPNLADRIQPINAEANKYIIDLCNKNWTNNRAVMFLDPYGMQVNWETIEAIASTQAIDLWILFPLGVAVNRLLKKNGDIRAGRKKRLDAIFGDSNWFEAFYQKDESLNLFSFMNSENDEEKTSWKKTANFQSIGEYYNKRLASVFPKVAPNPLPLYSSNNNPLYLLCFAAANPKAADTAVRIARDILKNHKIMSAKSPIEWTEATWNPVTGCNKISPGCKNCYAEVLSRRLKAMGQKNYRNGFKLTLQPHMLNLPLTWKKSQMIFVNSMSDLFHKDVPTEYIKQVFEVMNKAHWHTFQVLTKRAERLAELSDVLDWSENIWMGVSVENNNYVHRIDYLRDTKAQTKFLSLEPLLSPLKNLNLKNIDWVIVGGESGHKARPMKEKWAIDIQKQCEEQNVSFFFKQWGAWGADGQKRNKKANGRTLLGQEWNEKPQQSVAFA